MPAELERFLRRLDGGEPVTLVGLGDSLTYGWMVESGFFDRFARGLEQSRPGARVNAVNAGVPGDTAAGGLARLPRLLAQDPALVVVQFGLNDLFTGVDPERFETRYGEIAGAVRLAGSLPVLATSSPLPFPREQAEAQRYYDAIRRTGARLDLPVADLDLHWRRVLGSECFSPDLYLDDGAHPSDRGHALMAEGLLALFAVGP